MQHENHIELLELDAAKLILDCITQDQIKSHIDNMMSAGFFLDEFIELIDVNPFRFKSTFEKILSRLNIEIPDKEQAHWIIIKYYLKKIANGSETPLSAFQNISELFLGRYGYYGIDKLIGLYDDVDEIIKQPCVSYNNKFGNDAIKEIEKEMITESKIWLNKYNSNLKCVVTLENELTAPEIQSIKKLINYCNGSAEIIYKTDLEKETFVNLTKSFSLRLQNRPNLTTSSIITEVELNSFLKVLTQSEKFINQGIKEHKLSPDYKKEWIQLVSIATRNHTRWFTPTNERKNHWLMILIGGLGGFVYLAAIFYLYTHPFPTPGLTSEFINYVSVISIFIGYTFIAGFFVFKLIKK